MLEKIEVQTSQPITKVSEADPISINSDVVIFDLVFIVFLIISFYFGKKNGELDYKTEKMNEEIEEQKIKKMEQCKST